MFALILNGRRTPSLHTKPYWCCERTEGGAERAAGADALLMGGQREVMSSKGRIPGDGVHVGSFFV